MDKVLKLRVNCNELEVTDKDMELGKKNSTHLILIAKDEQGYKSLMKLIEK